MGWSVGPRRPIGVPSLKRLIEALVDEWRTPHRVRRLRHADHPSMTKPDLARDLRPYSHRDGRSPLLQVSYNSILEVNSDGAATPQPYRAGVLHAGVHRGPGADLAGVSRNCDAARSVSSRSDNLHAVSCGQRAERHPRLRARSRPSPLQYSRCSPHSRRSAALTIDRAARQVQDLPGSEGACRVTGRDGLDMPIRFYRYFGTAAKCGFADGLTA